LVGAGEGRTTPEETLARVAGGVSGACSETKAQVDPAGSDTAG